MLNIFVENLEFLKVLKIRAQIYSEQLVTEQAASDNLDSEVTTIQTPSGRFARAETWLTVYRSPYIRMLS